VSEESTELVREALDEFTTTHRAVGRLTAPDFVWDLGSFEGWPTNRNTPDPMASTSSSQRGPPRTKTGTSMCRTSAILITIACLQS
jgi:hypothetical protein